MHIQRPAIIYLPFNDANLCSAHHQSILFMCYVCTCYKIFFLIVWFSEPVRYFFRSSLCGFVWVEENESMRRAEDLSAVKTFYFKWYCFNWCLMPVCSWCVYLIHCILTGTLKIIAHEATSLRFFMGLWKTGDSY